MAIAGMAILMASRSLMRSMATRIRSSGSTMAAVSLKKNANPKMKPASRNQPRVTRSSPHAASRSTEASKMFANQPATMTAPAEKSVAKTKRKSRRSSRPAQFVSARISSATAPRIINMLTMRRNGQATSNGNM